MTYLNIFFAIFLFVSVNILLTNCSLVFKYANKPCTFNNGNFSGIYQPITFNCTTLPEGTYPKRITETIADSMTITWFCCPVIRVSEQVCNENNFNTEEVVRVMGSTPAYKGEIPYIAALFKQKVENSAGNVSLNYKQICGGSIISEWYILTAAHCLRNIEVEYFVVLGKIDIENITDEDKIKVTHIFMHQDYNARSKHHDIALIKTDRNINFTNFDVKPICLHSYKMNNGLFDYQLLQSSGWGRWDQQISEGSKILRKGEIVYVNQTYCQQHYSNLLIESQFCAFDNKSNVNWFNRTDTCQGDSGGPVSIHFDKSLVVVGIVSYGRGCGTMSPGVYTRVLSFIDWIESKVWLADNDNNHQISNFLNNQCSFNDGKFTGIFKPITFECNTLPSNIYPNKTIETINGGHETYFCCPDSRVSEQFCNAIIYSNVKVNGGEIPYIAAVFKQKIEGNVNPVHICGGSIISEWFILTSAFCFRYSKDHHYFVVLGKPNIGNLEDDDLIAIKEIYQHENNDDNSILHDIALIKTEKKIIFTNSIVSPICLHSYRINNGIFDTEQILISGWGFFNRGLSEKSETLHWSSVAYVNQTYCKRRRQFNQVFKSQFCTLDPNPNADYFTRISACIGHEGGPASIIVDDHSVLLGIISHTITCGNGWPDVHTRVLSFIDWIEEIVWFS